jgi:Protein of unknown function (DUF2971)
MANIKIPTAQLPPMLRYSAANPDFSLEKSTLAAIEAGKAPRILYKFRGPDEFTRKIIKNAAIYHSSPLYFNDPFDCQLSIDTTASFEEIVSYLVRNNKRLTLKEAKAQARNWQQHPIEFRKLVNEAAREAFSKHGVSCYAPTCDNLLMWSHYSNSHRGLCLKFDITEDLKPFSPLFEVEYQEKYPVLNHIKNHYGAVVTKLLTTKGSQWEYEHEWRVVKMGETGNHGFAHHALKEIIFGANANPKFIDEIVGLVEANRKYDVAFTKAHVSKTEFKLIFRPL